MKKIIAIEFREVKKAQLKRIYLDSFCGARVNVDHGITDFFVSYESNGENDVEIKEDQVDFQVYKTVSNHLSGNDKKGKENELTKEISDNIKNHNTQMYYENGQLQSDFDY